MQAVYLKKNCKNASDYNKRKSQNLRDYKITRLRNYEITRLREHETHKNMRFTRSIFLPNIPKSGVRSLLHAFYNQS